MPNFRLKVIQDPHALSQVSAFWRDQARTPLQSPEWMLAWWQAMGGPNSELCVLVANADDGQTVGLAPLFLREGWADGRSLRFLGSGRACGDFQTVLASPGHEVSVGAFFGEYLLEAQPKLNWSLLELEGTSPDDAAVNALVSALKRGRCFEQTSPLEHTWRLHLTNGWDSFLDGLSKTQRRQTRNWVNRFDKTDHWRVRIVEEAEHIPAALEQLVELHQRRWTAVGEPGCFADSRFKRFVENASQSLAAYGRVSIALFEEHGQPIACQFYLKDAAGNLYMYQTGRDPERDADGIGRIFNAVAVREACRRGVAYIDFLRGDEIYKGRLGAKPSVCLRQRLIAPALLPRIRNGVKTVGRSVRSRVKTLRERWGFGVANRRVVEEVDLQATSN